MSFSNLNVQENYFFFEKYPKILHSLKVSLIESKGELRSWGELLYEYKINIDRKTMTLYEKKTSY